MSALLKEPFPRLRPMDDADIAAVLDVERAGYAIPWTEGNFRDCVHAGYCCWVIETEAQIIGHGVLSVAVGEAHILNVCIHPHWQGRGLGRLLLERLLHLAREHEADTVFLEVRISNAVAQRLYESAGFNEIGQRRNYYPALGGREDAIVFAKALI